jgi:manganese/zinc/iron transport system permease protein
MPFGLDYTLLTIVAGASLLGVIGGVIGCFALLRRQSLLGDSLAHAALPGVCVAFLLTGTKAPLALLVGALVAGVVGSLFILAVVRTSRIKEDSAMGIVLSTFFGVGIVLLTWIQRLPGGNQSGLNHFLFGQTAALMTDDVIRMAVLGAIVLAVVCACSRSR